MGGGRAVGCGVWPGHSTQRNLISERHLNSMRTIIAGNLNLPTFCDSIQLPCQADDSMTSDGPRLPPPTARLPLAFVHIFSFRCLCYGHER